MRIPFGWARLVVATVAVGVASGLAGVALTLLLHAVQHVAFGYTENAFLTGVEKAGNVRRVCAVGVGGVIVGAGWWLHRRSTDASVSVTHALAQTDPALPLVPTSSDALLQIVAVGTGASLGREGAPRQVGAALAGLIARRVGLVPEQRRMLLAAGAGAGLAAVYNVPIGGAVFTLEVLLTLHRIRSALPAFAAAGIATVVAWPFLGDNPTYRLPGMSVHAATFVTALVIGPLAAIAGVAFRATMTRARTRAPRWWHAVVAVPITFTALGATAIAYPQLLGNGKNLAELGFTGALTSGLAAALAVLKPVATAACLRSGAIGGLLTPSFATGAALGALLGYTPIGGTQVQTVCALLGAAAFLAVAQRAPCTAVVLTLDFTHAPLSFAAPVACAVAAAKVTEHVLRRALRETSWRPCHHAEPAGGTSCSSVSV
jgi:H+/Cl- antiporter ClcA